MNHGSLFSGIGGFDLPAEWMGWENKFHCEINEFCNKILKHYWPDAQSYNDIKTTDFTIWRGKLDILTGGFPCQPYSLAGKRKGKEDDRHLWPEMLRAIREIQPRWVVGENVFGLINWSGGLVFHEVQADLEAEGYEVFPYVLPACAVNAPHRRDRVWFVAYCNKCSEGSPGKNRKIKSDWSKNNDEQEGRGIEGKQHIRRSKFLRASSNSSNERCNDGSNNREERHIQTNIGASGKDKSEWDGRECGIGELGAIDTNTNHKRLERGEINRSIARSGTVGNKLITGLFPPTWQNFPTQPPVCSGDDGLPTKLDGITFSKWRNESIKGYGNAVVPAVVYQIFKAIEQYESL